MEIKEIRYRVSSSTSITPSINLKEEKSLDIYEYDSYWQYVYIHILGSTKDKEFDDFEDIELGFMQGTYFKIDDMDNEGICKFDIFDSISQETYDVYTVLTKRLQKFYKSIGFKKIHKREHMYFNTDYIMKGTKE